MNAKKELLIDFEGLTIKCAAITKGDRWDDDRVMINLPMNYSSREWDAFLTSLDFDYDSGFGGQRLFGTVWFTDDTWAERGEYDGSEWWNHIEYPEIPEELWQI